MPTTREPESLPPYVTIVSRNPATLEGLRQYLGHAGIPSRATRAVLDISLVAPAHATAILIFPDDFAEKSVLALVAALRRTRPHLLTFLITQAPNRFRAALSVDDDRPPMPTIMPKPLFGELILDAIRSQAVKRRA